MFALRIGHGSARITSLVLFIALVLLAAPSAAEGSGRRLLQDEEGGDAEGGDACVKADFPLEFKHAVDFNVNEGIGFLKDDSTNLQCHCEDHHCDCTGEGEDCDEYSQLWFYGLAYAHQMGVFLYDFPKYNKEYHLESMVVWAILGVILGWLGFLTILYMEIKCVSVTRERDERFKLIAIRAMERSSKMVELEEMDARTMAPRPYVTICGAILLFIGLFCQLIPFCHLLSELGLPVSAMICDWVVNLEICVRFHTCWSSLPHFSVHRCVVGEAVVRGVVRGYFHGAN